MPELDGIAATRELAPRSGRRPRVLVLTTFDLDEYVFEAVQAGASGFLLKDATPGAAGRGDPRGRRGRLAARARTSRGGWSSGSRPPRRSPTPSGPLGELTERELEVLALVARGLSNGEIGERLVVSLPTVKTHVGRVLMKLGLRDRVQAVVFAYEAGVVRPGERDAEPA